jgi:hypothetical protein
MARVQRLLSGWEDSSETKEDDCGAGAHIRESTAIVEPEK